MYNNSYDVNILVNGNRCKQYQHQGKTFIEAKAGSEYVVEIKNNTYKRILAVSAVDGLNVLTGKTATEADSGYIIDSYHSEKIKGFRFSDDEWAMFRFGFKYDGKTYAQDKGNGAEKNCGVIGVRLFDEYQPPFYQWSTNNLTYTPYPYPPSEITCDSNNETYCCDFMSMDKSPLRSRTGAGGQSSKHMDYKQNVNFVNAKMGQKSAENSLKRSFAPQPKGFDMGTEWGRREKSTITHVDFTRGTNVFSHDIYYASRESLIEMGVPLSNKLQSSLPQAFPDKYATPPKHWNG